MTEQLEKLLDEFDQFNRMAIGREQRMIELKRQVNVMAPEAGVRPPYDLSFADGPDTASAAPAPPSVVEAPG